MKIATSNKQKLHRMNLSRVKALAYELAVAAGLARDGNAFGEVSVVFTDDPGITDVNRRFLCRAEPTDVISFAYESVPGMEQGRTGEIVINVQRAVEAGSKHGGIQRELALYIAHGMDHLSGEDDSTKRSYARMRRRELQWLRRAAQDDLLTGLVRETSPHRSRAPGGTP